MGVSIIAINIYLIYIDETLLNSMIEISTNIEKGVVINIPMMTD